MGKRGAEKFQNLQADNGIQSLQVPSSLHHYGFLLAESNDQILSVGNYKKKFGNILSLYGPSNNFQFSKKEMYFGVIQLSHFLVIY